MKLDLKKFCLLLSQAEGPPEPEGVNRYLLDHVLTPTLSGGNVRIGDIDFSRFEAEDIEDLARYCDGLYELQREARRLETRVSKIPPTAGKVRAFC